MSLYKSLSKRPILIRHEVSDFVASRLQAAVNNKTHSLISSGIVAARDLDAAVTSGPGLGWALAGPIVTSSLGGGGQDGFDWELNVLDRRSGPGGRILSSTDSIKVMEGYSCRKSRLPSGLGKSNGTPCARGHLSPTRWTRTGRQNQGRDMRRMRGFVERTWICAYDRHCRLEQHAVACWKTARAPAKPLGPPFPDTTGRVLKKAGNGISQTQPGTSDITGRCCREAAGELGGPP
jgi:hypothetical protein